MASERSETVGRAIYGAVGREGRTIGPGCLLGVGLWLAGVATLHAQPGAIGGVVSDAQGAALAGVTVTATSTQVGPVVARTDATGRFELGALLPGDYTVSFVLDGFESERREGVRVPVGGRLALRVELALASFAEQVEVVGVAPMLGAGLDRDRVPAAVAVLDADEIEARAAPSLADALNERLGAIAVEGATSNLFQPTIRFRGFTASPLLGLPQGIAVYQNGVRINEPFGDTVQFDLIPQFAIQRLELSAGSQPTFGLNALGGTLALDLKNGFDAGGVRGELSGGSFDRLAATAEFGQSYGPWGVYLGASRFDESGWRAQSPSEVTQAVADLSYRRGKVNAGIGLTYADSALNGNGAAPVELLEVNRSAVFTFPDTTENRLGFVQGRLDVTASSKWAVHLTGYYRDLDRHTLNGDEAEFSVCDDDRLPPGAPVGTLCAGGADDDDDRDAGDDDPAGGATGANGDRAPAAEADPLVDVLTGRFITEADAAGDGAFNRTATRAQGYGAAIQATGTFTLGQRENLLVLGASSDLADVAFSSTSEVGTLTPDRTVAGSGLFAGIFGAAPDDLFNTSIDTANRAVGLYFSDTLSVTGRLHLTVSGRFNRARLDIRDRLGSSLNGRHTFSRFNPGVGIAFGVTEAVSVFGRYTESNRAPTAAELSCADPAEPCRVPNAFVSDPPLRQAVARSVEGGMHGRWARGLGAVDWSLAVYRTRINDDILFVASPELIGTGFFQNAGDTQRVGLDADVSGQAARLRWYASYAFLDATFESPLELPGNPEVNDAATEEGRLAVQAGDRLAGIPRHGFKGGVSLDLTGAWAVGLEAIAASSRVYVGDEGNDQAPLDGYGLVNVRTSYRLRDGLELWMRIENVFDTDYATFGALAELEVPLAEAPDATDPRFLGPGAPRSAFGGVRVRF